MAVRQFVNLLRGSVRLEVAGDFPERFLNLAAQRGTAFWGLERPDDRTLRLTVAWTDRRGLEELAERTGCVIREGRKGGIPPFLLRFQKRYALLAGLILALLSALVLSRFIWVVEVRGNRRVPTQVILTELWRHGVRPGTYGPGIQARETANQVLLRLEDLSWMAINVRGITAQVEVREKTEPPEVVDRKELGDIVAEAPGLVTEITVLSGDAAVAEGATVLPGEVLIRGSVRMDPPEYSGLPVRYQPVRAMGKVEGRTWRTLTAAIPLTAQGKDYTGDEAVQWSVTFLGRRKNIFQSSSISAARYDKISHTWEGRLPLHLSLRREQFRGYETVTLPVDRTAARALLESQLLDQLLTQLGKSGQEVSHSFEEREAEGWLYVTLTAECTEELGRFLPAQRDEGETKVD